MEKETGKQTLDGVVARFNSEVLETFIDTVVAYQNLARLCEGKYLNGGELSYLTDIQTFPIDEIEAERLEGKTLNGCLEELISCTQRLQGILSDTGTHKH